jgi:plasmid replication initiation protein
VTKFPKDELSGDRLVVKNNQLVNAHYRLSAGEQKLVLTLCSKIKSDEVTFKEYEMDASEFFDLLGVKYEGGSQYNSLQNVCKKIVSRVIKLDTGNGFKMFPWMHHVEYKAKEGKVLLQFHEYLAPYLLYVKNNIYTKYKLGVVLNFKSEYSIRIYELMKQVFPKIKERVIALDELREILCIPKGEYEKYNNFKTKVINQAQKEINEKSDLEIVIEEIKQGRKVVALHFAISENWKNVAPIENWYDYQKYKEKSIDDLAEVFCDILKEKYKVEIPKNVVTIYSHRALLSTIFELKEGYYSKYDIKNPLLYFLKVLENKTSEDK